MANDVDVVGVIKFIEDKMNQRLKGNNHNIDAHTVFYNGDCGNLYELLKAAFPNEAKPYIIYVNGEPYHVVTRIGEKYYDITGEITLEEYKTYMKEKNGYSEEEHTYEIRPVEENDKTLLSMRHQYENTYAYDANFDEYTSLGTEIKDTIDKLKKAIMETVRDREGNITEFPTGFSPEM